MKRPNHEIYFRNSKSHRWINQCVLCGRVGYRPDLPEKTTARMRLGSDFAGFTTGIGEDLRKAFEPLELNTAGLCDVCETAASSSAGV